MFDNSLDRREMLPNCQDIWINPRRDLTAHFAIMIYLSRGCHWWLYTHWHSQSCINRVQCIRPFIVDLQCAKLLGLHTDTEDVFVSIHRCMWVLLLLFRAKSGTRRDGRSRVLAGAHTHTHTHTRMHARTHARAHAHTHAHTCTHARTHTNDTCVCV